MDDIPDTRKKIKMEVPTEDDKVARCQNQTLNAPVSPLKEMFRLFEKQLTEKVNSFQADFQ